MFRDSTTFSTELSPAEQTAFEALVRAVGFAREVHCGRGPQARPFRNFPDTLVYALTPVDQVQSHARAVREYRLFVALASDVSPASVNGTRPAKRGRPRKVRDTDEEAKPAHAKQGTLEYKAKMSRVGRANVRKRTKKFGPTGCAPGREPWKMPSNIAYKKHAAKLAREANGEAAPP